MLTANLQGCGFKLRGQASLPPQMAFTYLEITGAKNLPPRLVEQALRRALTANAVVVVDTPEEASATLRVLADRYRSRLLASDRSGDIREYNLTYALSFEVQAKSEILVPAQSVEAVRDILYDENQVLSRLEGEEIARDELVAEIARAVLRRIQIATQ